MLLGNGLVWSHAGDDVSHKSRFFQREEDRFGVQREPGRGGLFRVKKERLLAEGSSYTVTPLRGQDERQDTRRRGEFPYAFRGGNKRDGIPGRSTLGLYLGLRLEKGRKQHRIKSAPRVERFSVKLHMMCCWHQGDTPAHDIALLIKLGVRHTGKLRAEFFLAHLQEGRQVRRGERMPNVSKDMEYLTTHRLLHTIKLCC